ncbi:hypothetical protein [Oscillatoria acuminata]|uniref:DUF6788 domain-containing protein n=1 Tax=Oscillatoria acuminata PCC 6304 TaxID=56110 RepID=K9TCB3_9CYAN|nr:hypothetical protein [Oscillatoria acuminata]AFY80175.1 hypothetical protein Oscil6304_0426 [Oscillatoria acuminata PCC 6304]
MNPQFSNAHSTTSKQETLFDLSAFSRPDKTTVGDWGWENESDAAEPEIRRFKVSDRIQAKLPDSPEGVVVEIKQGKYAWSDTLLIQWDKNVPRKQRGTQSAISSSKALLLEEGESYPTESVIDEEKSSGKTEISVDERDEAIAQEYAQTMIPLVNLAQKYNLSGSKTVDILSARLGEEYSELVEFKRQENQRRYLTEDQIAPDDSGNYPPIPPKPQPDLMGKAETSQEERDEAIAQEYKEPHVSLLMLSQKYGISTREIYDILLDRFGSQLREVDKLKWQEGRRQNHPPTPEGEVQEDAEGDRTPPSSLFPIEEKYGPVESWPDSPEEGMFDFLSYPTESVIDEDSSTGKTGMGSGEGDRSHPEEITDQWGFWINTASDWGEFYWRGNQPTIETSAQECVILEDRGDRWLVVPVGKRPISLEGDGFATGCVKPYEIYKSTLSPDPPGTLSYPTEMINRHEDLTGKTIRQQILPMSISEKRSLLIWLQETIKDEEWTPPPVKSGRQVVGEPVKTSKGYRRQELVRCGKATCKSCPHGPYWYEYWSEGGKRRSKYLGKNP